MCGVAFVLRVFEQRASVTGGGPLFSAAGSAFLALETLPSRHPFAGDSVVITAISTWLWKARQELGCAFAVVKLVTTQSIASQELYNIASADRSDGTSSAHCRVNKFAVLVRLMALVADMLGTNLQAHAKTARRVCNIRTSQQTLNSVESLITS